MRTKFRFGDLVTLNSPTAELTGKVVGVRVVKTYLPSGSTRDISYKVLWNGELPMFVEEYRLRKWMNQEENGK